MKFKITATSSVYGDPEKLIEGYPCLENFGYELEEYEELKRYYIRDENGRRIKMEYGIETKYTPYVRIDSIEQLVELTKAVGNPLVFSEDEIEIYDSYRE